MHHRSVRFPRSFWAASLPLIGACLGCSSVATRQALEAPQPAAESREHDGLWRFRYDNDSVLFTDGNYSSGLHIGYLTRATERMAQDAFSARLASWLAPLPGLGDQNQRHYVSYSLGQLIFTPENLVPRDPGPDELPYTGLLFLDTGVYARTEDTLNAYHLLLGVTGEPSLGEESQKTLHRAFDQGRPRGWSHQSRDEPILNLSFEHHQRSARGQLKAGLEWDLAFNVGGGLGNFFTGLNSGLRLRLGQRLPNELGNLSLHSGIEATEVPLHRPNPHGSWHVFGGLESYIIGRYLPVDGNLLRDGRSTPGETLVASGSLGFSYSLPSLAITFTYTAISDIYKSQSETTQVGSLALTFFP